MKPVKLILHNFGPYENETIDFSGLDQVPVFLISGQTGSGKTTIFEALTFALYGESVTGDRPANSLRSDFAADTDPTEVTLIFDHQGKRYDISRRPKQILSKQRGTGTKEYGASAHLKVFEHDKKIEDTARTKEINIELERLLQINRDQFAQIVLLPQGDFRRFLTASSTDKEVVLRKLFRTQLYERWADTLKSQLKEASDQSKSWQATIKSNLGKIKWEKNPDNLETLNVEQQVKLLEEQQETTRERQEKQRKTLETDRSVVQKQSNVIEQAQTHNHQLDELDNLEHQQRQLQTRQLEMKQLQSEIDELQWAKNHQAANESLNQAQQQKSQNGQKIDESQSRLIKLQSDFKRLEQQHKKLEEKTDNYSEMKQEIPVLTRQRANFETVNKLAKDLDTAQHTSIKEQSVMDEYVQQQQKLDAKQTELQQLTNQLGDRQLVYNQSLHHRDRLAQFETELSKILKSESKLNGDKANLAVKIDKISEFKQNVEDAAEIKSDLENQRLVNHIAELAQQLKPGTPCPICGSTEHPSPAVAVEGQNVTKDDLNKADSELSKQNKILTVNQTEIEQLGLQIKNEQGDLDVSVTELATAIKKEKWLSIVNSQLDGIQNAIEDGRQVLKDQIDTLASELSDSQAASEKLAKLKVKQDELKISINDQQEKLTSSQNNLQTLTVKLSDAKEQLPHEFSDLKSLDEHLNQLNDDVMQFDDDQKKNQASISDVKSQIAASNSEIKVLTNRQNDLNLRIEEVRSDLKASLIKHFNSEDWEAFNELLNQVSQLDGYQKRYQDYAQQVSEVKARLETLHQLVSGDRVDIATETKKLKEFQQVVSDDNQLLERTTELYILNQNTLKTIQQSSDSLSKQAHDFQELEQLTATISGSGDAKLSLERYVLREYLLEILDTANGHLQQLSSGRYFLKLHEEAGTYQKDTGLELDVYDDNVGHPRSVHTLSGGESFITALSLALALGEVIQNQSGGITIDTLFIDEGFGSLDQDSLQTAMGALEHIEGDHRMIGIISHVQELKVEIPYQIQVTAQGQGKSHAKLILPQ
ncbi:SMC family ATPase [Paucilactobacillus suebicus]|uniref:Nuclease SbcCD subunit C n=1 Tax=Paucilactobacillus suebicus DSM 5007 = KCTC 3549 TaxID=1423807 RepID=A0A0R1W0P7_9LACO|nr:SMC family ATPase [Paucilactobacillus suebicus]KRM11173.1 exonuclease [Paucilactobacillus suebicus DSM 5007 = KCTC 3549]